MTLDELLTALGHADQALILPNGFNNPHSYRGYYDELAFEPAENISVADMAAAGWAAMDETFEGYKGGQYTMTGDTACWLAYEGSSGGEEITTELLARLLAAGARPTGCSDSHEQGSTEPAAGTAGTNQPTPGPVSDHSPSCGHDHWNWKCTEEVGGCGYVSPFASPTKEGARDALNAHFAGCKVWQASERKRAQLQQSEEAPPADRPTPAEPTVHQQLVEMHESENLPARACEDGALDVAAQHARELAALARTTGAAGAEDIIRFLEGHAAELDQKRTLLSRGTGKGRH